MASAPGNDGNAPLVRLREGTAVSYFNSVFTDGPGRALRVDEGSGGAFDAFDQFSAGRLQIVNNVFGSFGQGAAFSDFIRGDAAGTFATYVAGGNTSADPQIGAVCRDAEPGNCLNPKSSAAETMGADFSADKLGDWFLDVDYKGAFDPNAPVWIAGWTALDAFLNDDARAQAEGQTIRVTADITADTRWTSENEYLLDGLIFVDNGATLTIEAGTVVRGVLNTDITTGDGAAALIVRKGAKLMAVGTAEQPIIFTAEEDDLSDSGDLTEEDRGLWAGVILLGSAPTNQPTTNNQIEGIDPTSESAQYGGSNPADNSGSLRYVSIRHSGFSISGVEGDEIQGLTLGGVGNGTTIEYVEIFASNDDGIEIFGGTVDIKYAAVAFSADDGFDTDQGWSGRGQFWFCIQDDDEAGRCAEQDGGDDGGTNATPFSTGAISNATYIGSGVASAPGNDGNAPLVRLREGTAVSYFNSVFTDGPGRALRVDEGSGGAFDAFDQFSAGRLQIVNNVFGSFGQGAAFSDFIRGDAAGTFATYVAGGNTSADPQIGAVCRDAEPGNCLDPRVGSSSVAASGADYSADKLGDWFTEVSYRGAFDPRSRVWIAGWTALDALLNDGSKTVSIDQINEIAATSLAITAMPNPSSGMTRIQFALTESAPVYLAIYDLMGREITVLADGDVQPQGTFEASFDASTLAPGTYLYRLTTPNGSISRALTVVR